MILAAKIFLQKSDQFPVVAFAPRFLFQHFSRAAPPVLRFKSFRGHRQTGSEAVSLPQVRMSRATSTRSIEAGIQPTSNHAAVNRTTERKLLTWLHATPGKKPPLNECNECSRVLKKRERVG